MSKRNIFKNFLRNILYLVFGLLFMSLVMGFIWGMWHTSKDPYSVGSHWDYSISCEDGFVYKHLSNRRGTILVLNSDGTPLRCGHKRY